MQFECPVCKATGDISASDKDQKVSKTKCPQCAAILMVDPRSGSVDAHKAALKDAPRLGRDDHDAAGETVLSMGKHREQSRDWPAVVVVLIVLLVLIAGGIWLFPLIL